MFKTLHFEKLLSNKMDLSIRAFRLYKQGNNLKEVAILFEVQETNFEAPVTKTFQNH